MTAQPSNFEQLMVELINRARADPVGEIDRLLREDDPDIASAMNFFNVDVDLLRAQLAGTDPVAPLAWNEALGVSSHRHSQLMLEHEEQSHFLPGEPGIADRFRDAGYTNMSRAGENIFAFTDSPLHGHAGFYIDWGYGPGGIQDPAGHRLNILNAEYTEIGIGVIENVPSTVVGPHLVTQHFGDRYGDDPKITGVVIDDSDNDDFYDIGEGLGGVTVRAVAGGLTFTTVTYASGGYTLEVPSGTWNVTFSGGALGGTVTRTVTVSGRNVKLDAELDDVAAPDGPLVGDGDADVLVGTDGAERIRGMGGNDVLRGLGADDLLEGGAGADALEGGAGVDMASFEKSFAGVRVIIGKNKTDGGEAAGDSLSDVEYLIGSVHEDVLGGNGESNRLSGNDGKDVLLGLGGEDTLHGGAGHDVLRGDAGADKLNGYSGMDMAMYTDSRAGVEIDLARGRGWGGSAQGDELIRIEHVRGSHFADTLSGNREGNLFEGRGGNDAILGGKSRDWISGDAGNDVLTGGAGEDRFLFNDRNWGTDHVTDFKDGADMIKMNESGLSFADLSIVSDNGDTKISFGEQNVIILDDVHRSLIDADDFIF